MQYLHILFTTYYRHNFFKFFCFLHFVKFSLRRKPQQIHFGNRSGKKVRPKNILEQ
jgi:hypothetical protein